MKRILYFAVTLVTATLLYSCHSQAHGEEDSHDHNQSVDEPTVAEEHAHGVDEIVFTPEQASRAGLLVEELAPADFAEVIEVSGRVMPAQGTEATVTATMSGIVRLTDLQLTDGSPVKTGTPLLYINARPMADGNPVAAAQAELTASRAALERAERLAAEEIISQRELEDVRRRYTAAKGAAESLGNEKRVRSINSPLSGYVKDLLVKNGDYVTEGQPLLTVTQNRRLQLRADVPERYYASLNRIRSANFRMAYDKTDHTYALANLDGRLVSKGQSTDSGEFFVPVTFEFNNQGSFVPGSLAQIYLLGDVRRGILAVPFGAIAEGQGLHFVYLQLDDHSYRRQEVRIGATDGRRVEIVEGLHPGDRVVTRGTTQVKLAANASVAPEGHKH